MLIGVRGNVAMVFTKTLKPVLMKRMKDFDGALTARQA